MRVLKIAAVAAVLAAAGAAAPANAQAVLNTSLANINGPQGVGGSATTTTTASGTVTTVTGPGGDAARAYVAPATGVWQQSAVGGGGSVGITTQYSNDGDGAAFFASPGPNGKADLNYNFAAPVALSSLTSMSFDFYDDPANTSVFSPVMRLNLTDNGAYAGSLVLEYHYQNQTDAAAGVWTTLSATMNSGILWATNGLLGPTNAAAVGGELTLSQWLAANPREDIEVTGLSVGIGSGQTGSYSGGVDHVQVAFTGGPNDNFDFKVGSAVPEPGAWALMILGFGGAGVMLRRRRAVATA